MVQTFKEYKNLMVRRKREHGVQERVIRMINKGTAVACLWSPHFDLRDLHFYMLYDVDGNPVGLLEFSTFSPAHYFESGGRDRACIKYEIYIGVTK